MFDLSDRPLVWIPIKWTVLRPPERKPSDKRDEGVAVETEVTIDVHVEIFDREQLTELLGDDFSLISGEAMPTEDGVEVDPEAEPLTTRQIEARRFMKIVSGWRKFKDKGNLVPFDEEHVIKLLKVPGFISAFEAAYMAACAGKSDIRRKN